MPDLATLFSILTLFYASYAYNKISDMSKRYAQSTDVDRVAERMAIHAQDIADRLERLGEKISDISERQRIQEIARIELERSAEILSSLRDGQS